MINTGCKKPDLVNILEVPEVIQKVLEYVRESKLAIIKQLKNLEQTKNRLRNSFAVFWAYFRPIGLHVGWGAVGVVVDWAGVGWSKIGVGWDRGVVG